MYVLPKGLESAWSAARGKGYVMRTGKPGEALVSDSFYEVLQFAESPLQLAAIGMGMAMVCISQLPIPT